MPIQYERVQFTSLRKTGKCSYDSICPECGMGILHMRRNPLTFKLDKKDICLSCGQRFVYTDLKYVEKSLEGSQWKT